MEIKTAIETEVIAQGFDKIAEEVAALSINDRVALNERVKERFGAKKRTGFRGQMWAEVIKAIRAPRTVTPPKDEPERTIRFKK